MGYASGSIKPPVNSSDVQLATDCDSHDWGHFCAAYNTGIQKWSLWKPYRCAGLGSPTNLQVAQMKFGIDVSTARHTGLENAVKSVGNVQPLPSAVTQASSPYRYDPPTGGDASPYRITDFADDDDPDAPAGLQFKRWYDPAACAPDEWHDWTLTEERLRSLSEETVSAAPGGGTSWTVDGTKGISYSFCSIRYGVASQETVGYRPSNAMPLSLLFGNGTIADENWRLALAVYLPYGLDSSNTKARWMLFAGRKPLSSSNGGEALPHTASSIELCKALYYNFKTKGVTGFTFIPCIIANSTLGGTAVTSSSYTTRVVLQTATYNSQLLLAPTFDRRTLTITATPVPGQVEQYSDSSFRGLYATNLVAGTYRVAVGMSSGTGGNTTISIDYYRITLTSGSSIKIEYAASGYSSSGNLKITASGSSISYYKYADQAACNSDTVSGAALSGAPANVAKLFRSYVGASVPAHVTPYLMVTKI